MKNILKILGLSFLTACSASHDTKICEWRGADRTGIFPETNLLKEWPADGPNETWAINDIGTGQGSPVFMDDRLYITGETDSMTVLYCYNLDGKQQWNSILGTEWMTTYPGTRSAPTIAGDLIYLENGMGNLYCVNRHTGKLVWSKSSKDDAEGILTLHGMTEAPVIDGDKVFWVPGGSIINVTALNRFTGETIWSSEGFTERSGYNQGNLIKLPERNIFVTFSAYHLMGFDSETGKMLWFQEQDNTTPGERKIGLGDTHANNVIYSEGAIYYAAGDGNCGVKLNLSPNGTSIAEAWRNKYFDSFMGGIVKIGNYLYGGGTAKPELRSVDAGTGQSIDSLRIGSGAIIAADDMIYYYSQKGDLYLISYDSGKMQVVSSFRIKKGTREHFSHPVIYRGILYQRHGNVLIAYDIREK